MRLLIAREGVIQVAELSLQPGESNFFGRDDEPMFESDFTDRRLKDASQVFTVAFRTGREWESEQVDGGGMTINTQPDPRLTVYETLNGMVFTLAADTPDPMVFFGLCVSHGQHISLVERIVENLDESYFGIEEITEVRAVDGYEHLSDAAKSATDRVTPSDTPD